MKKGTYRARGVVLHSIDFGESDRILTFYTLEQGKLKGIAKGARRSRKRFVGNLDPLSHINIVYHHSDKSELVRVEDASLIDAFSILKTDIERLSDGCYLLELTNELTREGQVLPDAYHCLVAFLKLLESGSGPEALRFFEVKLLALSGYLPHLAGCMSCGASGENERLYFSSAKGGLVCRACASALTGLIAVSPGTAALLSMAARLEPAKLGRLKPGPAFLDESERLLYDFIKYQLGKELKTRRFMAKLKSAQA
ncbi:DNA repair protein RecO [uncultured bacterium]|nr:DNA repair protein RecO [uncultured bacterium]